MAERAGARGAVPAPARVRASGAGPGDGTPGGPVHETIFAPGWPVTVRRSDGRLDPNWKIVAHLPEGVLVEGAGLQKLYPPAALLAENPSLLPVGLTVQVRRSSGAIDDDWRIGEIGAPGAPPRTVRVVGPNGVRKDVPVADLISLNDAILNADRLLPRTAPREAHLPAPWALVAQLAAPPAVPRPRIFQTVPGPGAEVACQYQTRHRIEAGQHIPDGYFDGGRAMVIQSDGQVRSSREVLVVDRTRDPELATRLRMARNLRVMPERMRFEQLARFVNDLYTSEPRRYQDDYPPELRGHELLAGDVAALSGRGVCRHRTLMFKLLADEAGLSVAMVRGNHGALTQGAHVWNEITLDAQRYVVDLSVDGLDGEQRPRLRTLQSARREYFDPRGNFVY